MWSNREEESDERPGEPTEGEMVREGRNEK